MEDKGVFNKRWLNLMIAFVMLFTAVFFSTGCAPKEFTVNFIGGAEDAVLEWGDEEQTVTNSSQIVEPIYIRPGYNFVGWDRSISMIEGSTTVKAQWREYEFQVVFQSTGGRTEDNQEVVVVKSNSAFELKQKQPKFEKKGYELSWDTDLSTITLSCTVNAVWTPKQYELEFLNRFGVPFNNNKMQITYNEILEDITVDAPKVTDKKFAYWADGTSSDALPIDKGIVWHEDKNTAFYPHYVDKNDFIIRYDLDGGQRAQRIHSYNANTDEYANIISDAEREGYIFEGWHIGDSKVPKLSNKITINDFKNDIGQFRDVTLKASWGNRPYVINFDVQGGKLTGQSSKEVIYNHAVGQMPTAEKDGYVFVGWYYKGKIITEQDIWEYPTDATITARYLAEYKVKFSLTAEINTNDKIINCKVVNVGSLPQNKSIEEIELTLFEGQSFYTAFGFTKLPIVTPIEQSGQDEYDFGGYWKWIDEKGNEHVIEATTVFSLDIFYSVLGGETITLMPHCRAIWSPTA